jgi:CBS domain-containing protein
VVVAEVKQGQPHPTGIVTDRDIVISVLAAGLDPNVFTLGDIATPGLVVAREGEGVFTAVRRMRAKGVRRLPVVDEAGVLKGIFTLDDYIGLLADEVREAASIIDREQTKEVRTRVAIPG